MEENTIVLNGNNFVGDKIKLNTEKIDNNVNAVYLIVQNADITKELLEKIHILKNLKKIWLTNCNILEKFRTGKVESLRVERCENLVNIIFENNLKQLYIEDCKQFDIKYITNLDLNVLRLEYIKIDNFSLLEEMKSLKTLELKEIDLTNIDIKKLKYLNKIVLNGSKVNDRENIINYFKLQNIEIEFLEKNLPIG